MVCDRQTKMLSQEKPHHSRGHETFWWSQYANSLYRLSGHLNLRPAFLDFFVSCLFHLVVFLAVRISADVKTRQGQNMKTQRQ